MAHTDHRVAAVLTVPGSDGVYARGWVSRGTPAVGGICLPWWGGEGGRGGGDEADSELHEEFVCRGHRLYFVLCLSTRRLSHEKKEQLVFIKFLFVTTPQSIFIIRSLFLHILGQGLFPHFTKGEIEAWGCEATCVETDN